MSKLTVTEITKLWKKILDLSKESLKNDPVYDSFFEGTFITKVDGDKFYITCPSEFSTLVLKEKYYDLLKRCVDRVTQSNYDLIFLYNNVEPVVKPKEEPPRFNTTKYFQNAFLEPKFTFENFVVGSSNKTAKEGALMVALAPGEMYNPFYLYAPSGLGKTHLLNAIGNYVKEKNPASKVIYVPTTDFVDEFMKFIKNPTDEETLSDFLRTYDVILLDDVQLLARKKETQDYFFKILDSLIRSKKQIVLSSDRPAKDLKDIQQRIVTRFYSGLSLEIEKPTVKLCEEILKIKIKGNGLNVENFDNDVIELLAKTFKNNIRELEGALLRLLFFSNMNHQQKINMKLAVTALNGLVNTDSTENEMNSNRIIDSVAQYYNLAPDQLTGKLRQGQIVNARHIAIYLLHKDLGLNYKEIGDIFSGRDRTTIMYSVEKVENLLKADENFAKILKTIRLKIN